MRKRCCFSSAASSSNSGQISNLSGKDRSLFLLLAERWIIYSGLPQLPLFAITIHSCGFWCNNMTPVGGVDLVGHHQIHFNMLYSFQTNKKKRSAACLEPWCKEIKHFGNYFPLFATISVENTANSPTLLLQAVLRCNMSVNKQHFLLMCPKTSTTWRHCLNCKVSPECRQQFAHRLRKSRKKL